MNGMKGKRRREGRGREGGRRRRTVGKEGAREGGAMDEGRDE